MSKHVIESLIFRPGTELPATDMDGRDVLVYQLCDGWLLGRVSVIEDDDGEPPYVTIDDYRHNILRPAMWAYLPDYGENLQSLAPEE
ncbi:hypothetical protein FCM30_21825 [Lelliottia aquatilis]|uniref:hypothetical protein n=1 Tax=Lelliottia aquatilis TaxID=2080838 RepID=UPI0015755378|nr:hypothetical protein [Lelliottia aquatilis]NTZ48379.1 hypothetical protein [Lelliottia aquatilis]